MRGYYGRGERGLGNARRDWELPNPISTDKLQQQSKKRPFTKASSESAGVSSSSHDVEMGDHHQVASSASIRIQQEQQSMDEASFSSRPNDPSVSESAAHQKQETTTISVHPSNPFEDDDDNNDEEIIIPHQQLPMKRPPQENIVQQHPPPPPPPQPFSFNDLDSLRQVQQQVETSVPSSSSSSFSRAVERPRQQSLPSTSGSNIETGDRGLFTSFDRKNIENFSSSNISVSIAPSVTGTEISSVTDRTSTSSAKMPPPPPVFTHPKKTAAPLGNPFDLLSTAKKYNYVPKSELHCLYGKRRKVISSESYHTWHNGGQAHSLKWTSIFVCPITGELFTSGRYAGGEYTTTSDGTVWYSKKLHAEHAAAARAYDCMIFRYPTFPPSSVDSLGEDIPYAETSAMFVVPAGIPAIVADKIRNQQNTFRNENGFPSLL